MSGHFLGDMAIAVTYPRGISPDSSYFISINHELFTRNKARLNCWGKVYLQQDFCGDRFCLI
jgi:hypothetical protein